MEDKQIKKTKGERTRKRNGGGSKLKEEIITDTLLTFNIIIFFDYYYELINTKSVRQNIMNENCFRISTESYRTKINWYLVNQSRNSEVRSKSQKRF